jgi:catechol 2,3-dioxygenase-like lactoylglutathione lyase family enzyme
MPDVPTSNPEQFYQGAPVLLVPDVPATADFYRRVLGFRTDPGTDTPEYTVVWRDNAALHLARASISPSGVRPSSGSGTWTCCTRSRWTGVAIDVPIGTRP